MKDLAIKKIDEELKTFKGSRHGEAVHKEVASALKDFAEQDAEFAQAIVQNDKTLSDCCEEIMKGAGSSMSDIEVYRRAVRFYFPGAGVNFSMTIDLCASADGGDKPGITLNLADFF